MNPTIWHILKKDFGRMRYMVAVLAGVLLVKAALVLVVETAHADWLHPIPLNALSVWEVVELISNEKMRSLVEPVIMVIVAADFLALIALLAWLFSEDSAINDRAFWRTRPVSGAQMFAAKAIFIILVTWPLQMALQVATTVLAGFPANLWLDAMGPMVEIQAAFLAVIVISAMLWKNIFIGFAAMFTVIFAIFNIVDYEPAFAPECYAVTLITLAVVLARVMYGTGNRVKGFIVLAIGLGVLFFLRVM